MVCSLILLFQIEALLRRLGNDGTLPLAGEGSGGGARQKHRRRGLATRVALFDAAGRHCSAARTLRFSSRLLLSTAITLSPFASSKLVTTTLSSALGRSFNCGSFQSP